MLVGYVDRWGANPGEALRFYVSSDEDYSVSIVRLIHGDTNPRGPGFKTKPIGNLAEKLPKGEQAIHLGSYVRYEPDAAFPRTNYIISLAIWPTLFGPGEQGIANHTAANGGGFSLLLNAQGQVVLRAGGCELVSPPVKIRRWTSLVASIASDGRVQLLVSPKDFDPAAGWPYFRDATGAVDNANQAAKFLVGALTEPTPYQPAGCFNGKIGRVRLYPGAMDPAQMRALAAGQALTAQPALAWHFGQEVSSRRAVDISGHDRHGEVVNRPTRGVTGDLWQAWVDRYKDAPDQYDAIYFHADDLEDCRWSTSFTYDIPAAMKSGVYAMELKSAAETRYLSFFVTAPLGKATAPVAVLLPTASYLAYSNESLEPELLGALTPLRNRHLQKEDYAYLHANHLHSLYDRHIDGSGRCMTTVLRPNLTSMNPSHRCRLYDAPHQLCADLHLIDWLEHEKIPYDVITDHELHRYGADILKPYKTVLTGTHAEYWTADMLDGLEAYKQQGGRFVYLSGNGLYWIIALDETGAIGEIRRCGGTESWKAAAGEAIISLTGEQGGLWKDRGRAPQRYVGVGMASQGFDRGAPYQRKEGSHDPRAAFIFDGITDGLVGDFPALTLGFGAAGYEVDRVDYNLGTPAHALVLATSTGFSDSYQYVREETFFTTPFDGGTLNPEVRSDMVYFECPNGGAVFSVGSISFCSALSYNGYNNDISRLLKNVVSAFGELTAG